MDLMICRFHLSYFFEVSSVIIISLIFVLCTVLNVLSKIVFMFNLIFCSIEFNISMEKG